MRNLLKLAIFMLWLVFPTAQNNNTIAQPPTKPTADKNNSTSSKLEKNIDITSPRELEINFLYGFTLDGYFYINKKLVKEIDATTCQLKAEINNWNSVDMEENEEYFFIKSKRSLNNIKTNDYFVFCFLADNNLHIPHANINIKSNFINEKDMKYNDTDRKDKGVNFCVKPMGKWEIIQTRPPLTLLWNTPYSSNTGNILFDNFSFSENGFKIRIKKSENNTFYALQIWTNEPLKLNEGEYTISFKSKSTHTFELFSRLGNQKSIPDNSFNDISFKITESDNWQEHKYPFNFISSIDNFLYFQLGRAPSNTVFEITDIVISPNK